MAERKFRDSLRSLNVGMKTPLRARRPPHQPQIGFTLIELMVTVSIVAILAAIAYPSYRDYVIRGQLVSATSGLSALQANMERYFQDNRTYAPANTFNPPCLTASQMGTFKIWCPTTPPIPPPGTQPTYQAEADGSSNTAGFKFLIDQAGVQTTTVGAPAPANWTSGSPYACWITKAGGC